MNERGITRTIRTVKFSEEFLRREFECTRSATRRCRFCGGVDKFRIARHPLTTG